MSDEIKGDAQAIVDAVKSLHRVELLDIIDSDGHAPGVIVKPRGMEVLSAKPFLDEYLDRPERKAGTAKLETLASFNAHAIRFKDGESALFATRGKDLQPKLISVLDYHEGGSGQPRFCRHRGEYCFPVSEEWQRWTEFDDEELSQRDFARFLENRIADIADAGSAGDAAKEFGRKMGLVFAQPAKLLELSEGLTVRVDGKVTNATNLSSGEGLIHFSETHKDEAGQPLKVPRAFLLAIPVFRGGANYQLPVRLRYRVQGGSVSWTYSIYRADAAFDHAFNEACTHAQEATGLPLFFGSPES